MTDKPRRPRPQQRPQQPVPVQPVSGPSSFPQMQPTKPAPKAEASGSGISVPRKIRKYPALRFVSIVYYVLAALTALSWLVSVIMAIISGAAMATFMAAGSVNGPLDTGLAVAQIGDGPSALEQLEQLEREADAADDGGGGGGFAAVLGILFMLLMTTVFHGMIIVMLLSMAELIKLMIDVQFNTQIAAIAAAKR